MTDIAALLDQPDTTIAVVGATDDPAKYGSVIYRDLKRKGFIVFPINPARKTVAGDNAFARISDLPHLPTLANIVVPPLVSLEIAKECLSLGLKNVWLQPGAEDPRVLTFLQENNFNYLANACIMVQSRFKT